MVFFRLLTACAPWSVTPSREALEGDGLTSDIVNRGSRCAAVEIGASALPTDIALSTSVSSVSAASASHHDTVLLKSPQASP